MHILFFVLAVVTAHGQISFGSASGPPTGPIVDARSYGCVADNSTDNATCINNALAALVTAGGGTLYFAPAAAAYYTTPFSIPVTGSGTSRTQVPLRLTGVGGFTGVADGGASAAAGSILRFGSTSNPGKITMLGTGIVEIDHLALQDTDTASTVPFIYNTSTTLRFHHNTVRGANTGPTNNIEDAIVLGGDAVDGFHDGTKDSAFAGYGTVIDSNYFDHIARAVWLRSSANAVQITNNTVWANSGWTDTNASAIELSNTHSASSSNNYITGNLIEITGYVYGVYEATGAYNTFHNMFFDAGGGTVANYKVTGGPNFIVDTTVDGKPSVSESTGANLVFSVTNAGYVQQNYEWHFGGRLVTDSTGTLQSGARSSDPGCTTTDHLGRFWFDNGTTTTAFKVCMNVAGTVQWVTK